MSRKLMALVSAIGMWAGCGPVHNRALVQETESNDKAVLREALQPFFEHPENIDYATVKQHVVGLCLSCHSLESPTHDLDAIVNSANMTSYQTLFNKFTPIVVKGNVEGSALFHSVAVTQAMPPARLGYEPLDGLRLKLLRLWILNCAIEDKKALGDETLVHNPDAPEKVRMCEEPH